MAGGVGAEIAPPSASVGVLFGEDQARYLLTTADPEPVLADARKAGVPAARLGSTGGRELKLARRQHMAV